MPHSWDGPTLPCQSWPSFCPLFTKTLVSVMTMVVTAGADMERSGRHALSNPEEALENLDLLHGGGQAPAGEL